MKTFAWYLVSVQRNGSILPVGYYRTLTACRKYWKRCPSTWKASAVCALAWKAGKTESKVYNLAR